MAYQNLPKRRKNERKEKKKIVPGVWAQSRHNFDDDVHVGHQRDSVPVAAGRDQLQLFPTPLGLITSSLGPLLEGALRRLK